MPRGRHPSTVPREGMCRRRWHLAGGDTHRHAEACGQLLDLAEGSACNILLTTKAQMAYRHARVCSFSEECNILRIASVARFNNPHPARFEPNLKGRAMTTTEEIKNVVLVHGAFADGSGWRRVYDLLTARGYRVSIVQNPLTSFAEAVAATTRVLDAQDGPAILVGQSGGGTVITEAGVRSKVAGLVYVSALIPDVGETSGQQYEGFAAAPEFVIDVTDGGFGYLNRDA